jgi:hypothetical protein
MQSFEVAQLETLIRRMDDWQRDGLWLWLNGGFLSYGTLSPRSGAGEPFVFHLMF